MAEVRQPSHPATREIRRKTRRAQWLAAQAPTAVSLVGQTETHEPIILVAGRQLVYSSDSPQRPEGTLAEERPARRPWSLFSSISHLVGRTMRCAAHAPRRPTSPVNGHPVGRAEGARSRAW